MEEAWSSMTQSGTMRGPTPPCQVFEDLFSATFEVRQIQLPNGGNVFVK